MPIAFMSRALGARGAGAVSLVPASADRQMVESGRHVRAISAMSISSADSAKLSAAAPADRAARSAAVASTFPFIDALRAAAALMVVVYHVIENSAWKEFPIQGPWLTFRIGWVGVDLFFVISGFVIAHSALRDYRRDAAGFHRRFATRRLARIVPLYLLTCLAYVFLVNPELFVIPPAEAAKHALTHLLFVHNLHTSTFGSINGPNWSVALEMQFYLFMVLIVPWLSRRGAAMVLLLIPLAIVYRYGTTLIVPPSASSNAFHQHVFVSQLPGTLDEFAVGIFIAMLMNGTGAVRRFFQPDWKNFAGWVVLAAVMLTITMSIYWPRANYWDNAAMVTGWRTLLGISFACLVAAAITFPGAKWLALRPLRYLGEISYGIYLWHVPVLLTLLAVPGLRGTRLLICVLIGTLGLASFTWHWFEKPLIERYRGRA